jgi:hypothetical protein
VQEDFEAAVGPAELLFEVGQEVVGGDAAGEGFGDEYRAPLFAVQFDGGPDVLGVAGGVQAADVLEGGAAEDDVGADAEHGVEVVLAGADEFVEDPLGF